MTICLTESIKCQEWTQLFLITFRKIIGLNLQLILTFTAILALIWLISRRTKELSFGVLVIGFILHIAAGWAFISIYSNHYGQGTLSADAEQFLNESKQLNSVYYQDKTAYFRLLLGGGEDRELIDKYLKDSRHWETVSQLVFNDNRNLLRIHSLIHFISGGLVYVHLLVFLFISLLSKIVLSSALKQIITLKQKWIFLGIVILPSVLFWSSTILKEPLLFLGIALFLYGALRSDLNLYKRITAIIFGIMLVLFFKPYILLCLIPSFLIAYLYQKLKTKIFLMSSLLATIVILLTYFLSPLGDSIANKMGRKQFDFVNISQGGVHLQNGEQHYYVSPDQMDLIKVIHDSIIVQETMSVKQFDYFYNYTPKSVILQKGDRYLKFFDNPRSESYIELRPIGKDKVRLLKNIPVSIINTILRPLPWDQGSWLKYPAMIETWLMVIALIISIRAAKNMTKAQRSLIIGIVVFTFILSILIGLVTPVLGAINRYRIPIYLALGIAIILIWGVRKKQHNG